MPARDNLITFFEALLLTMVLLACGVMLAAATGTATQVGAVVGLLVAGALAWQTRACRLEA
jgi:hypothetical protein